jgi:hypothetical protein
VVPGCKRHLEDSELARSGNLPSWYTNWIASLPLILLTVLIHVLGLVAIRDGVVGFLDRVVVRRQFGIVFALVMSSAALLVTALHAAEAAVWSVAYVVLGALPDAKSAMLYSLSAMTTYGHASIYLEPQWQMMGAVESLNGVVLLGFTTAALFSIIERVSKASGN